MTSSHGSRRHAAGTSIRKERLEELIREELDFLFDGEISDRRLLGTHITRVVISAEGARADSWFIAPRGADDLATERALIGARSFLRARLCEALDLKRTPELRFFSATSFLERSKDD